MRVCVCVCVCLCVCVFSWRSRSFQILFVGEIPLRSYALIAALAMCVCGCVYGVCVCVRESARSRVRLGVDVWDGRRGREGGRDYTNVFSVCMFACEGV